VVERSRANRVSNAVRRGAKGFLAVISKLVDLTLMTVGPGNIRTAKT
jgi:hypothetical protein